MSTVRRDRRLLEIRAAARGGGRLLSKYRAPGSTGPAAERRQMSGNGYPLSAAVGLHTHTERWRFAVIGKVGENAQNSVSPKFNYHLRLSRTFANFFPVRSPLQPGVPVSCFSRRITVVLSFARAVSYFDFESRWDTS